MKKLNLVLCAFLILASIPSALSISRTISSSNDNIYNMIRNSRGSYWEATPGNIQLAIDDLGPEGGTVWLPGDRRFNITSTVIVRENVVLDMVGSSLKLPPGPGMTMVELKNGAGIRNGVIDVAGLEYFWKSYTNFLEPNSAIFINATSMIDHALIENMAIEAIGLGFNNSIYHYFYLRFNGSSENSEWENPANLLDSSTGTYATGNGTDSIRLDSNTYTTSYQDGYYGPRNITRVYLRAYVQQSNTSMNVTLTPVFTGGLGDQHMLSYANNSYTGWTQITNDTNAPSEWSWSDLENLDCYLNASVDSGHNVNVSIVEILVYTNSTPAFYDPTFSGRGYGIHLYAGNYSVPQRISGVVVRDTFIRAFAHGIFIQNERDPQDGEPGAHIDGNVFHDLWIYGNEIQVNISRNSAADKENCSISGNVFNMIQFQTGRESWWGGEEITKNTIVSDGYENIFTAIVGWDPAHIRHESGELCADVSGTPCFQVVFTNDSESNYILGRCGLENETWSFGKIANDGIKNTRFGTSFGWINISSVVTEG